MVSSPQNPNQNFPDNVLYEMDNLDVLRGMNSETVDLIATDPPFNTKRNRAGSAGFYVDNWKWGDTGKLPDQWAWNEVHPIWLDEIRDENRALFEVIEAAGHCHGHDIAAFLCFLSVRLLEMHRVLKPTGSLYLHCDHTANAYIRMALDAIFGAKNFRNEVVWQRTEGHTTTGKFGNVTDILLFYGKSPSTTWNRLYNNPSEKQTARLKHIDPFGRTYKLENLTAARPDSNSGKFRWRGTLPGSSRGWGYKVEQLETWWDDGRIETKKDGTPRTDGLRVYAEQSKGKTLQNIWTDIPRIPNTSSERTGSPDQKPLALYERIILASSHPGDLVLDPFAGCATTIMAAQNNGRRWIGIDRRPDARLHVVSRMLGLKAAEAEKQVQSLMYGDWITARLSELDTHYRTTAPVRTDTGETAAPFLKPVYTQNEKSILSHKEMKDYLTDTFGLQCWGCNFVAPDDRYLQLDHVDPKAAGGSNHLDNRALLCGPCNMTKGDRITINELRRQNTKEDRLTKPPGIKRGDDGHPINLPRARQTCREALESHRIGQPIQLGIIL